MTPTSGQQASQPELEEQLADFEQAKQAEDEATINVFRITFEKPLDTETFKRALTVLSHFEPKRRLSIIDMFGRATHLPLEAGKPPKLLPKGVRISKMSDLLDDLSNLILKLDRGEEYVMPKPGGSPSLDPVARGLMKIFAKHFGLKPTAG